MLFSRQKLKKRLLAAFLMDGGDSRRLLNSVMADAGIRSVA